MCKKLQLLGDESPRPTTGALPLDHTGASDPPDPLAALSGNESLCFSLRLCFRNDTSAARQTPGGPGIRGTDSWLNDTDKNVGPNLPLLFKMYEIWSVDSQGNH